MRRAWGIASKTAFLAAADFFDDNLRDRRFTEAHARAAGYKRRKGELQPPGSKAFRRSYAGRKASQYKHQRPLEFSGDTRDRLRTGGSKTATANKARITYRQAAKFNFRHPNSQINMAEEFSRVLPEENQQMAHHYDTRLDQELADSNFR